MSAKDQERSTDEVWVQLCEAGELDPAKRLAARLAILGNPDAQDCSLYRPDENDPDAEEEDLGDAKILFTGLFQAPETWDEATRAEFFDDADPELFMTAFIECEARPASAKFFTPEVGDYVATLPGLGAVVMFYVHDYLEDENGRKCILIRDNEAMD
ncbi:hypothetical protein [Pseudomonas sp. 2FE]|uniref:hypothetical protein n=1 Tax=Pseudomonas sp. 2FE TaxID=2502190 RepID=UPI0010F6DC64|nr:hypothetical protein [Pseudomonas sp. 2FE]